MLRVRVMKQCAATHGAPSLILCDDEGRSLSSQRSIKLGMSVDNLPTLTVEFICNPDRIALELDKEPVA